MIVGEFSVRGGVEVVVIVSDVKFDCFFDVIVVVTGIWLETFLYVSSRTVLRSSGVTAMVPSLRLRG